MRAISRATSRTLAIALFALFPAATEARESLPALSARETHALFAERAVVARSFSIGDASALVAYAVVDAPASEVLRVLADVRSYPHVLPVNRGARTLAIADRDTWVALEHGTSLVSAKFVARVRAEPGHIIRFWLDPRFEHDVDSVWGYFRVERISARGSLLTYAAALDIGSPIWKALFTGAVMKHARRTPELVRAYVERSRTGWPIGMKARAAPRPPHSRGGPAKPRRPRAPPAAAR